MQKSFYFYDLETSGLKSREDRIMQFAGLRTDLDFHPISEPHNILVELPDDTLPSPGAIMTTGITPNKTRMDGISERDFCRFFVEDVATPNTTIIGYNSVRFDDEFMRNTLWRNFYDPYTWQWQNGRTRWDMLDVVRMTRALRSEGINWPVTPEGRPTNRLELITKENGISHEHAHDALSDVEALISVTKLIKEKQPQLFDFLYQFRTKNAVMKLVNPDNPRPFVYSSGRYGAEHNFTTVAYPVANLGNGQILVFDLRYNLDDLLAGEEAAKAAGTIDKKKPFRERDPWEKDYFPIAKKLQYNHCPAVAPVSVLDKDDGWEKLDLDRNEVDRNLKSLLAHPEFIERMIKLLDREFETSRDVEGQIYDGFISKPDQYLCDVIRGGEANDLADFHPDFKDERLEKLLLRYKGRNFPSALTEPEAEEWQKCRRERLERQAPKFLQELALVGNDLNKGKAWGGRTIEECEFLLEELKLWYQSLQESD